MKKEILRLENVAGGGEAGLLRSVDLCLYEGETLGVTGLADSGLRELAGLLTGRTPVAAGAIYVEGRRVTIRSPKEAYSLGIRYLSGDVPLNDTLTVAENMFLTTFSAKRPFFLQYHRMNAMCRYCLEHFKLDIDPAARAGKLTPAQQGYVMLARAAYESGRIIVLDNWLPKYTPGEFTQLLRMIRSMARRGFSFLMTTYALQSGFFEVDRAVVLRDGQTAGVVEHPQRERRRLYRMLLGETAAVEPHCTASPKGEALRANGLKIAGCARTFSFTVGRGEICGVLDEESGEAEKLTRTLSGQSPDLWQDGLIWIDGNGYRFVSVTQALRAGIMYLPENAPVNGLLPNLSIGDNLLLPALQKLRTGVVGRRMSTYLDSYFAAQLPDGQRIRPEQQTGALSLWERWLVLLCKIRLIRPRVAVLMHPTAYMDEDLRKCLYRELRALSREGIAVLLLTRDPRDLEAVCDRMIVL